MHINRYAIFASSKPINYQNFEWEDLNFFVGGSDWDDIKIIVNGLHDRYPEMQIVIRDHNMYNIDDPDKLSGLIFPYIKFEDIDKHDDRILPFEELRKLQERQYNV